MGIRDAVSVFAERGSSPAQARFARSVQRFALPQPQWLLVADAAARPAAVGNCLSADPTLARSGRFRDPRALLRALLRQLGGREPDPGAAIVDSRTLHSTCESGGRGLPWRQKEKRQQNPYRAQAFRLGCGYPGAPHLGHLLALSVTPANGGDRAQVGALCEQVQEVTGQSVQLVWVDQGYNGEGAAQEAAQAGVELHVVKLPQAKKRWVVERSFAWANRFRRLVKEYERLPQTLRGLHFCAFACLRAQKLIKLLLSP